MADTQDDGTPVAAAAGGADSPAPKSAGVTTFALFGALSSVMTVIASVLRSKVSAHWLGPEGIGIIAEITQVMTLATTAATVAVGPALIAWIAESRRENDTARMQRAFGTSLLLGAALTGVGAAIAVVVAPWVLPASWGVPVRTLMALAGASSLVTIVASSVGSIFVGTADIRSMTISGIAGTVVATILAVVLVITWGLTGSFWAQALGSVGSLVIAIVLFFRRRDLGLRLAAAWDSGYVKASFAIAATSMVAAMMSQMLYSFIRAELQHVGGDLRGAAYNGNFQAAYLIGNTYFNIVVAGLGNYFWPRYAAAKGSAELTDEVHAAGKFILQTAPPIVFAALAVRTLIIHTLYSSRFDIAISILGYQLAGDIAKGISWVYAGPLIYRGRVRAYLVGETIALLLGVAFNFLFIRHFGPVGSGLAYTASYVCFAVVAPFILRAACDVRIDWRQLVAALALTGAAALFELVSSRYGVVRWVALPLIVFWLYRAGLLERALARFRRRAA